MDKQAQHYYKNQKQELKKIVDQNISESCASFILQKQIILVLGVLDIFYLNMYYLQKDIYQCSFDDFSESIHPNFIPTDLYDERQERQERKQPSLENVPKQKSSVKLAKVNKIRTNRNAQKVYHTTLKHWLQASKFSNIVSKYQRYFNQRIYFILILQEISKLEGGHDFIRSYQERIQEIKKRKENEVSHQAISAENCQYFQHLKRVIQELDYSVKACRQFQQGNILNAITIVYKRGQEKITKIKDYNKALHIYEHENGCKPENL